MTGTMVEFRGNGRTSSGYLATPAGGRGPGVVVVQEWWGLVDHIKDVANRFAADGFVALAPDLYQGAQAPSPDEAEKLRMALDVARASGDLRGAAAYLLAHDAVRPKKVAVVGFCMGGQLALFAAAEHADVISAAVDFYGLHPSVEIDAGKVRAPVLAHFGRRDRGLPEARAAAVVERLRAAGVAIDAYFYDAGHAFFNDARPRAYDEASAALAWTRTVQFLRRHLA